MGRSRVRIKWVRKAHTYQPRSETTMPATPPPMPCPSPRPAAMLDSTTTPSACVVAPRSASTSSKSLTSSRAALSIRSANVLAIASSPTGGLTVRAPRPRQPTDAGSLAVRVEEVDEPAEVPVGEDAFELAVGADDQEVTDIVLAHHGEWRPDRGRGRHRFRVGNHDIRGSYQLLHHGALPSSPPAAP